MVPKGNRLCSSKNALWLPKDTCGTTCSRQNTPAAVLCSLQLTPLSGPGTMSLSMPHRATVRCCCVGRETESCPLYSSHPAQPPGDGAVQGKGSIFCTETFCWGTGSAVPVFCWVLAQCMAKGLPSSLLEQAEEADTYTGQNLFPNTSFISFSHEIFLLEYSLHLENRREFFYKAHQIIDYIETSPAHLRS